VKETYGLDIVVHPHADTHIDTEEHVERFLDATDSDLVSLCLDTGHYAYCGGDSVKLIETYGERIGYLHLKQVDPEILAGVRAGGVPFGPAVRRGVMCEPPNGVPELGPVLTAAQGLGVDLFAIVEQDMYPCDPGRTAQALAHRRPDPQVPALLWRLRAVRPGSPRAPESRGPRGIEADRAGGTGPTDGAGPAGGPLDGPLSVVRASVHSTDTSSRHGRQS
jgi:hypothetical protein